MMERIARWSLLLAAVLQFGIAAGAPSEHLSALARSGAAQPAPGGEGDSGPDSPAHGEQTCLLCQTLLTIGFVPGQALLLPGRVVQVRDLPEPPTRYTPPSRDAARARAPPLA